MKVDPELQLVFKSLPDDLHARIIECCDRHGIKGRSRERVLKWAEMVAFNHGFLEALGLGHIEIVRWQGGEPHFSLTEAGKRFVEEELLPRGGVRLATREDAP